MHPKGAGVGDMMIGRDEDGDAVSVLANDESGCGSHGRRGVARLGFEQDRRFAADLCQLSLDEGSVSLAGDDDQPTLRGQRRDPQHSLLEARTLADQRDELLGAVGSGRRP